MKTIALLLLIGLLAVAGCGDEDDDAPANSGSEDAAMKKEDAAMKKEDAAMKKEDAAMKKEDAAMKKEDAAMKKEDAAMKNGRRATIALGDSEFGSMLFDSRKQAIYVFENDPKGETVCYDDCAEAWPPVLTNGKPKAGHGVDASLLDTVKRRDGKLQVTYADQPLYFYAHERAGEVKCHNVNLNGGFWWVVGADGNHLS